MATVYRKTVTKRLPKGAELFTREGKCFARWKGASGKTRTAPVTVPKKGKHAGQDRIVLVSPKYIAKYRDGKGVVREVATGCRDETAARGVLAELERRAELVKGGVLTADQDAVADHQGTPLASHFDAYIDYLRAKGTTAGRMRDTRSRLQRAADDCGFTQLANMNADALDGWLSIHAAEGMSAATLNSYLEAYVAFGYWCAGKRIKGRTARYNGEKRLTANPFGGMSNYDQRADPRRQRRALTEAELLRLLGVARRRPLADYGRLAVRKDQADVKRKRDTWKAAPLTWETLGAAERRARERLAKNPKLVGRLELRGWERALIYKTLVLTGLRKGELASVTVGQVELNAQPAYIVLNAADEKARRGAEIPLRADLAKDLSEWLDHKLQALQGDPKRSDGASVDRLPSDTPLFNVPDKLVKVLNRDLIAAGIVKRDDRGRTVDVHALRHTFGTLLSKGGVAPRTAQAAMRHSSIDLTMNTYTDPRLLDVAGAMDALPSLPLDRSGEAEPVHLRATGTDGEPIDDTAARNEIHGDADVNLDERNNPEFAPGFAPTSDKHGTSGTIPGAAGYFLKDGEPADDDRKVSQSNELASGDKYSQTGRYRTRTCDPLGVNEVL